MSPELEKQIALKYPKLFVNKNKSPKETLICFGCECGDGWYNILDHLFGFLTCLMERKFSLNYSKEFKEQHKNKPDFYENYYSYKHLPPQIVLDQVKEKFGTLRVYYHYDYSDVPENILLFIDKNEIQKNLNEFYQKVDNAIEYADYQSSKTCEITGKEGKYYTKGWCRVLCDEEAKKCGYIPTTDATELIWENE
jgi:hypothetical protein